MDSKISMIEGLIMVMAAMFFDVLEFFLSLLDAGTISAWITNPFFMWPMQFFLFMKGIRGLQFLAGNLLDYIPVINMIPVVKTATVIIVILLANNPKTSAILSHKIPVKV